MIRARAGGSSTALLERSPLIIAAVLVLTACAGADDTSVALASAARGAVVGGSEDLAHPAVVALVARRTSCADDDSQFFCTGTLIAPRVVLTAAHCLDVLGADGAYEVSFGAATGAGADAWGVVIDARTHPGFDRETHANDLALLRLAEPAPVAPQAIPAAVGAGLPRVGDAVRIVGFGETLGDEAPGVKRTGTMVVSEVHADALVTTRPSAMSCRGDSGGPVLATLDDGTELLVAVTASGDTACAEWAMNVRVDTALDFVAPYLAEVGTTEPGFAGRLDPAALCDTSCASSADCPVGLVCVAGDGPSRCVLLGPGEGAFGATCDTDPECDHACVRLTPDACRCFTPCAGEPGALPEAGGCAAAGTPLSLVLVGALFYATRRRRRAQPAFGTV